MITIKPISNEELKIVFDLEKDIWPDFLQAEFEQLMARYRAFPNGIIGLWLKEVPIGFSTNQLIQYNEYMNKYDLISFLPKRSGKRTDHNPNGNCLHFLSCGIMDKFRRRGLWKLLISNRISIAKQMKLKYILVDSRMPFFKNNNYKINSPIEYGYYKKDGNYIDPYLSNFQKFGFSILDIVPSSYSDPPSGDHWAFMTKTL